jgi:hypothetical protein
MQLLIKTKVTLPQAYVTLVNFGNSVEALFDIYIYNKPCLCRSTDFFLYSVIFCILIVNARYNIIEK